MANRKNTFLIKRSNTPGKVPSSGDLILGELALNTADVILYASGTTSNSILPIGWDRISRTGDTMTGTLLVSAMSATTISATTYFGLPIDINVTGGTTNNSNKTYTFTNNSGGTFTLNGLIDLNITGGTFNNATDIITLTNNTGGTINITGITDNFTTGSTRINDTVYFNRNDQLSAYTSDVSLSSINARLLYNDSSTGIIEFSGLSFVTSATTYSVAPIKAWFVDNTTDAANPSRQYVEIPASTGNTVSGITAQNVTYIAINSGGTITQQSTPFTSTQQRTLIHLGVVVHSSRTIINAINNQPVVAISPNSQLSDLIESLNVFNITGNTISANGTNLSINKSQGQIFKQGVNFVNDNKNPHILSLAALTAPSTIRYRFQNGIESSNTALIDPNTYDVSGTGTTVPNTKYTIQRIYLFQSNLIRIQYGQRYYDSIDDARAGILKYPFVTEQNLAENGLLRGYLIVRKGCTDLTNTEQAIFIESSRFGFVAETNTGTGLFRTQILNDSSSGLLSGGSISIISSTGGTVNISAGKGIVVDNTTDPSLPSLTEVSWSATTGITITGLNSQPGTGLFVTTAGTFTQINITNLPSGSDIRDKIFLGAIGHPQSALTLTFNVPNAIINPVSQINDLSSSIGPFSINGNRISKITGSLALTKSVGKAYMSNAQYQTDRTNPSVLTTAVLSASTLSFVKQNQFIGFSGSSIDTNRYDNGGVLTNLPNNDFVAHRIWHQPSSNFLFFQYGQVNYSSLANARAGFASENYIVPSPLEYAAYLVAVILVKQGSTTLDAANSAEIIPQGKFAGTGGGGSGIDTLQSVYNNSTTPEIITDSTLGALTIRNGGVAGANVLEAMNSGGTVTAFITGDGVISGSTYLGLPTDIYTTGGTYTAGTATFKNNTGGTFSVSGFSTGATLTSTQIAFGSTGNTLTSSTGLTWTDSSGTLSATNYLGKSMILDGLITGAYALSVRGVSTPLSVISSNSNATKIALVDAVSTTRGYLGADATNNFTVWTNTASAIRFAVGSTSYLTTKLEIGDSATPTATLTIAAGTTTNAPLRLISGVAPTAPNSGDIWNNGTYITFKDPIASNSYTGVTGQTRMAEVNSSGQVSATKQIITAYLLSGSTAASALTTTSNWNASGVYTGTTITNTYQGQSYYNSSYYFTAVDDNLWIRMARI